MFMYDIGAEVFDSLTEEEKADVIEVDGKKHIRKIYEALQEYPGENFKWFCWKDKLSGQITITVMKYSTCVWAKSGYPDELEEDVKILRSGKIPAGGEDDPERLKAEMVVLAFAELIDSGGTNE